MYIQRPALFNGAHPVNNNENSMDGKTVQLPIESLQSELMVTPDRKKYQPFAGFAVLTPTFPAWEKAIAGLKKKLKLETDKSTKYDK